MEIRFIKLKRQKVEWLGVNCWGYSSNPDPCPTNHAVWILPLSGLLIDLRKIVQNLRMKTDHEIGAHYYFPPFLRIVRCSSQFILLCLSPYSTQFLYINCQYHYQVEFWGKVSGSVVTCQYWIGRRYYFSYIPFFLLAIRKYTVIRSPLVISDFHLVQTIAFSVQAIC